jgi:hypothetical protein
METDVSLLEKVSWETAGYTTSTKEDLSFIRKKPKA